MSESKNKKQKADRMKDFLEKKYAKLRTENEKVQERRKDLEDKMTQLNMTEDEKDEARRNLAKV